MVRSGECDSLGETAYRRTQEMRIGISISNFRNRHPPMAGHWATGS